MSCATLLKNLDGQIRRYYVIILCLNWSPFSHVDFLVYNSLTKEPIQVIEVDGWHFHKGNEVQQARDIIKDAMLTKLGIRFNRISTTTTVNEVTIRQILQLNQMATQQ